MAPREAGTIEWVLRSSRLLTALMSPWATFPVSVQAWERDRTRLALLSEGRGAESLGSPAECVLSLQDGSGEGESQMSCKDPLRHLLRYSRALAHSGVWGNYWKFWGKHPTVLKPRQD